jgi:hypothetical protein
MSIAGEGSGRFGSSPRGCSRRSAALRRFRTTVRRAADAEPGGRPSVAPGLRAGQLRQDHGADECQSAPTSSLRDKEVVLTPCLQVPRTKADAGGHNGCSAPMPMCPSALSGHPSSSCGSDDPAAKTAADGLARRGRLWTMMDSSPRDRAIDVGADASDNVGGGIEEPLKPDPVGDSGVTRRTSTSICRTGGGPSGSGCVGSGAMISRYFVGPSASRLLCVP